MNRGVLESTGKEFGSRREGGAVGTVFEREGRRERTESRLYCTANFRTLQA